MKYYVHNVEKTFSVHIEVLYGRKQPLSLYLFLKEVSYNALQNSIYYAFHIFNLIEIKKSLLRFLHNLFMHTKLK